jgi:hypothetical protein
MAKALTAEQRKMRIEMVDFMAQWVISQAKAEYYTPEDDRVFDYSNLSCC